MSRETLQHLNTNVLIGDTAVRGKAWHWRAEDQGEESNHYEGGIPYADVVRRLFDWTALKVPFAAELPADVETMDHLDGEGAPKRWQYASGRVAIVRSDTGEVMGVFKDGYEPHQYVEWLLNVQSNIVGDRLHISSAGLLRGGAVAWVEIGIPETVQPKCGYVFKPHILGGTSFDGSIATFFKNTNNATVCDNTFEIARSEVGPTYKVKHTRNSGFKLSAARDALMILEQSADEFAAEVEALAATTVTDRQWFQWLEEVAPTFKDNEKLTGRSLTIATNKQEALRRLWNHDERVAPWKGTALGVLAAHNTWTTHEQTVRGEAGRQERAMLNVVTGAQAKSDDGALAALNRVLVGAA